MLAVELDELAAQRDAVELLEEFAALTSAAEAELTHELLVAGFLASGAANVANEFAVSHQIHSKTFSEYGFRTACGEQWSELGIEFQAMLPTIDVAAARLREL